MLRRQLIAAALSIVAAPAFAASPYSAIYSFGDSLSDAGNLYLATLAHPPLQPAPPYYVYSVGPIQLGEFSNGPVWVQDLAAKLGLPIPLPSSLPGGTDYAWGFATTGGLSSPPFPPPLVPTLKQQVGAFLLTQSGVAPSTGLYTFSIGANDLFNILNAGLGFTSAAQTAAASAAQVVGMEGGVLELAGARDLILFDVPDLGKTPYVQSFGPTTVEDASELSAYFDRQVTHDLATDAPGLKVFDLDTYALIDEAVGPPPGFGFTDVTDPCYGGPFTGGPPTPCADPDKYLFWDGVHPTAAGHMLIADHAYSIVPEPATWAMALVGFAGLALAGMRGAVRRRAAPSQARA